MRSRNINVNNHNNSSSALSPANKNNSPNTTTSTSSRTSGLRRAAAATINNPKQATTAVVVVPSSSSVTPSVVKNDTSINKRTTKVASSNSGSSTASLLFTNTRSSLKKNLDVVVQRRAEQLREQERSNVHRKVVAEEMGRKENDPLVEIRLEHEMKTAEERHSELHGGGGGGGVSPPTSSLTKGTTVGGTVGNFSSAQQEVIRTRQLVDHFRARAQLAQAAVVVIDNINKLVDVDEVKLFPKPPAASLSKKSRVVVPLRQRHNFLKGLANATGSGVVDFEEEERHFLNNNNNNNDGGKTKEGRQTATEDNDDIVDEDDDSGAMMMRRRNTQSANHARRNHIWAQYEEIAQRLQQGSHSHQLVGGSEGHGRREEEEGVEEEDGGSSGIAQSVARDDLLELLKGEQGRIESIWGGGDERGVIKKRRVREGSVSNDGDDFPSSSSSEDAYVIVGVDGSGPIVGGGGGRREEDFDSDEWSFCRCICHDRAVDDCDACSECTCDNHSRSFSDSLSSTHSPDHETTRQHQQQPIQTIPKQPRRKKSVDLELLAKRNELQRLRRAMKKRARGLDATPTKPKPPIGAITTAHHASVLTATTTGEEGDGAAIDDETLVEEARQALEQAHRRQRAVELLNATLDDASLLLTSDGRLRDFNMLLRPQQHREKNRGEYNCDNNTSSPQSPPLPAALSSEGTMVSNVTAHPSMTFNPLRALSGSTATSIVIGNGGGGKGQNSKNRTFLNGAMFPQSQWWESSHTNNAAANPEDFRFLRYYRPPEVVLHERADLVTERLYAASTFVELGGGTGVDLMMSPSRQTSQGERSRRDDEDDDSRSSGVLVSDPTRKGFTNNNVTSSSPSTTTFVVPPLEAGKGAAVLLCREPSTDLTVVKEIIVGGLAPPATTTTSSLSSGFFSGGGGDFDSASSIVEGGGGVGSGGEVLPQPIPNEGGAVAFGVPDVTSPYEALRMPPEFSSVSSSRIAEVVATDACDVILASENMLRYVNACVKQGRRVGSVETEFDRVDKCTLRIMLWASECTHQTRRLVQGTKGIERGINAELAEKRKDVVDAVEDIATLNHRVTKLRAEVGSALKEARDLEASLTLQHSLLHSVSSPFSSSHNVILPTTTTTTTTPPLTPISPPPRPAGGGGVAVSPSTSVRGRDGAGGGRLSITMTPQPPPPPPSSTPSSRGNNRPTSDDISSRVKTGAPALSPPKHLLDDLDTGIAALSRLRQHLLKWSILRGKKTATFNNAASSSTSFTATTTTSQRQQQSLESTATLLLPATPGGGGGGQLGGSSGSFMMDGNANNTVVAGSTALSPLASLFSTKGAAAKLKAAQQQQQNSDVPGQRNGSTGMTSPVGEEEEDPAVALSLSSTFPTSSDPSASVDFAFQTLLDDLATRQKVISLWKEAGEAAGSLVSSKLAVSSSSVKLMK